MHRPLAVVALTLATTAAAVLPTRSAATAAPAAGPTAGTADLEARVAALEAWKTQAERTMQQLSQFLTSKPERASDVAGLRGFGLISVKIADKAYSDVINTRSSYEDRLSWTATYDLVGLDAPVLAVRGIYEFSDLFGDVRLEIPVEIEARLDPAKPTVLENQGFSYAINNSGHLWVRTTPIERMKVRYRVSQVAYEDGRVVSY